MGQTCFVYIAKHVWPISPDLVIQNGRSHRRIGATVRPHLIVIFDYFISEICAMWSFGNPLAGPNHVNHSQNSWFNSESWEKNQVKSWAMGKQVQVTHKLAPGWPWKHLGDFFFDRFCNVNRWEMPWFMGNSLHDIVRKKYVFLYVPLSLLSKAIAFSFWVMTHRSKDNSSFERKFCDMFFRIIPTRSFNNLSV